MSGRIRAAGFTIGVTIVLAGAYRVLTLRSAIHDGQVVSLGSIVGTIALGVLFIAAAGILGRRPSAPPVTSAFKDQAQNSLAAAPEALTASALAARMGLVDPASDPSARALATALTQLVREGRIQVVGRSGPERYYTDAKQLGGG